MKPPRRVLPAALLVFAIGCIGCADRCRTARAECRYECERQFELCRIRKVNIDYCRAQLGDCDLDCDHATASCSGAWW
jgi:hypothetical protein